MPMIVCDVQETYMQQEPVLEYSEPLTQPLVDHLPKPKYGSITEDSDTASIYSCSTTFDNAVSHDLEHHADGKTYAYNGYGPWKSFFLQEVSQDIFLYIELLLLTFCTGILDAMTISAYRVFCSKQTGNTISIAWLALEPSKSEPSQINAILSFSLFVCSAFLFGWAGNLIGHRRRLWLLLSNFLSTLFLLAAAVLQQFSIGPSRSLAEQGIIGLLAMACGGQLQLALSVRIPDLNTSMITTALVNLASDPQLLCKENAVRNQRVMYWLTILAGAFVGVSALKYTGPTVAILLAAGVKVNVGLLFLFNPAVLVKLD